MSRGLSIISLVLLFIAVTYAHQGVVQDIRTHSPERETQILEAAESVAIIFQNYPAQNTLLMRRLLLQEPLNQHRLYSEFPNQVLRTEKGPEYGLLRPPRAWELLSVSHIPRLFSFFTAADLGGYGDNQPPYEPSNPYPPDGASDVPMENLTLMWQGGDPDPDDIVHYDIYFGTHPDPPFLMGNIHETQYIITQLPHPCSRS
jgi:hypothetical protein